VWGEMRKGAGGVGWGELVVGCWNEGRAVAAKSDWIAVPWVKASVHVLGDVVGGLGGGRGFVAVRPLENFCVGGGGGGVRSLCR